ncbi:MAG: RsbRD N-terminal domain-containing protein [Calditrichota bacterium]
MSLHDILIQRRSAILEEWRATLHAIYPAETVQFLQRQKNQFMNPVGRAAEECTQQLLDFLSQPNNQTDPPEALDYLLKIRSVQDFEPSAALQFIPELKSIVYRLGSAGIQSEEIQEEFRQFEQRIDELTLKAFDLYVQHREKVYELRAEALRRQYAKVLEQADRGIFRSQDTSSEATS